MWAGRDSYRLRGCWYRTTVRVPATWTLYSYEHYPVESEAVRLLLQTMWEGSMANSFMLVSERMAARLVELDPRIRPRHLPGRGCVVGRALYAQYDHIKLIPQVDWIPLSDSYMLYEWVLRWSEWRGDNG